MNCPPPGVYADLASTKNRRWPFLVKSPGGFDARRQRPLPELVRVPVGIGIMRRISIRRIPMRRIMRSRRCTVPVGAPGSPPCYARVRHRCPGHADYVNEDRGWSVGACKAALQNPDTED